MSDSFDAKVMAAILSSGRTLASVGNVAAIIDGFGCWYASRTATIFLLAFSLVCWLIGSYLAARVALDRELFGILAEDSWADVSSLDSLLLRWNMKKKARPRDLPDRYFGALRLWKVQRHALAAQLAGLIAAITCEALGKR